jgi:hypothetical protein
MRWSVRAASWPARCWSRTGLSIRDYLLRLIRNDQQRPPVTEWLARLRRLEPLDLGAPTADLVQADRAARDLEPFPEQRQP